MKPLRYLLPAIASIVIGISVHSAQAQDASFGCKILLCVASQNPSWQGVSYCVPPVLKLLSIRKVHPGYWPSCPEAGTKEPGYAEYEDCPAGTTATTINAYSGHGGNMRDTAVCAKPVQVACTTLFNRSRHFGNIDYLKSDQFRRDGNTLHDDRDHSETEAQRSYYFDIRNKETGNVARYHFNLRN